jgi:hypothetical protein
MSYGDIASIAEKRANNACDVVVINVEAVAFPVRKSSAYGASAILLAFHIFICVQRNSVQNL